MLKNELKIKQKELKNNYSEKWDNENLSRTSSL